eukprot:ANDGO_06444.mRNA.1 2-hydroxyacid dehydrogenase homolog
MANFKIAFFSARNYDRLFFNKAASAHPEIQISYFDSLLDESTVKLVDGSDAVCVFVNDDVNAKVIGQLQKAGVKLILTRSAGFNQIDLVAAQKCGLPVMRVPAYSPHSPAEHAVSMILALNRKLHKAYNRVREGNFDIDGLQGFDMFGKTVGVVGTGKIGAIVCRILSQGFQCKVLCFDKYESDEVKKLGCKYVSLDELLAASDIISLHAPLTKETEHMINVDAIAKCKSGVMIINTGRGALIDTRALIDGLKSKKISAAGLDVYEKEKEYFYKDCSAEAVADDLLSRLLTFPNVLITSHQAFLTHEALTAIAEVTVGNVATFRSQKSNEKMTNEVRPEDANF